MLLLLAVSGPAFAGVTAWLPIEIDNGQIFFPVTLNGAPARAMLDSGAEGNAVSRQFLDDNGGDYSQGTPIILIGVNEEVHTNLVDDVQLGMFGAEFEVDDLMPFESDRKQFIVGLPLFNQFVVQIDYPGRQMRLITHDSVDMKQFANVKMKPVANSVQPMVQVDLNGEDRSWLIFDTGSNSGVYIQRNQAQQHDWLERFDTDSSTSTGIAGTTVGTDVFYLPMMKIGPFTLENVRVSVPAEGGKINLQEFRPDDWSTGTKVKRSKAADGILGYEILKHFIVTIDLKRSLLNLDVPR